MRKLIITLAFVGLAHGSTARQAHGYGLEDIISGTRYHADLTTPNAKCSGFNDNSARFLAWYNDALDVYLNNGTFVRDYILDEWDKVHFDDLFTSTRAINQWKRYVHGAFYGLLWAAENNEVMAAVHFLGILTHAIQDFYAHSTWVNHPERRLKSALDYTETQVRDWAAPYDIWTGAYLQSPPANRVPHGDNKTCGWGTQWGIGLDRSVCAKARSDYRIIPEQHTEAIAQQLFTAARTRSGADTTRVLNLLGTWMAAAGKSAFWNTVKTYNGRVAPSPETIVFSSAPDWSFFGNTDANSAKLPIGFLSGGSYGAGSGWYYRVVVTTTNGTDGDVRFKVTYADGTNNYWALNRPDYDDFEDGDVDAYYVGPAQKTPVSVSLGVKGGWTWEFCADVWAFKVGSSTAKYGKIATARCGEIDGSSSWQYRTFNVTAPSGPAAVNLNLFK